MEKDVRAVGIDPGTLSFSIFGIEGDRIILDKDIPTADVDRDPEKVVDIIKSVEPDIISGPSGYGLTLKHVKELNEYDRFLSTLLRREDTSLSVLSGLHAVIRLSVDYNLPMYLIPSVILLPTVPKFRKYNKIDMGTADKLCVAVLGVYEQSRMMSIPYEEVSFILAEIGGAYTTVVGIENGQVVDGIGGTQGPMGFINHGRMDGEVAYILGEFQKAVLFEGGASYIAAGRIISPDEFFKKVDRDEKYYEAYVALLEDIMKFIKALTVSVRNPKEILVSGRLSRYDKLLKDLADGLSDIGPVRPLEGFKAKAKRPAQGAALVADGIAGGPRRNLIEHMKIKEASGTVVDYVIFKEWKNALRRASGLEW